MGGARPQNQHPVANGARRLPYLAFWHLLSRREAPRPAAARQFRDERAPHLTLLTHQLGLKSREVRTRTPLEPEPPARHAAANSAAHRFCYSCGGHRQLHLSRHAAATSLPPPPRRSAPFCTRVRARTRGAVSGRVRVRRCGCRCGCTWWRGRGCRSSRGRGRDDSCLRSLRHNLQARLWWTSRLGRARRWRVRRLVRAVQPLAILVVLTVLVMLTMLTVPRQKYLLCSPTHCTR